MKMIQNIKSEKIRAILSGSATPAQDFLAEMGTDRLTIEEKNEGLQYFSTRGGLQYCATAEMSFCRDCNR